MPAVRAQIEPSWGPQIVGEAGGGSDYMAGLEAKLRVG